MIFYLHGFLSSPASSKAQILAQALASEGRGEQLWCEALPTSPKAAIAQIETALLHHLNRGERCGLIGSSLGGYYSTWLAEKYGLKAVLVNPALLAHSALDTLVGEHTHYYTSEKVVFTEENLAELKALDVSSLTHPENFLVLLEAEDETLNAAQTAAHYRACGVSHLEMAAGGNHSYSRFAEKLPAILAFLTR